MATNYIKIEVDYGASVARVGELEMTFKQLETASTKSSKAIKKAVRDSETSLAGTVKALGREKAALIESQSTLARNNEEYRKFQRQINIVQKQIDTLTDTRKREEVTLKNSANGLKKQIALIQQEMNNRKLSNNQYRKMQEEVNRLEARYNSLTNTVKEGTVAAFDQQIAALQREQREVATTTKRIEELEQEITSLKMRKAELAGATRDGSKAMEGMSSSAGAAGATVTEFGRTIGDAPFGLMGMANNLQQLSQQFVDLQAKSGGTKDAIKSIMATMMGPAGFVVVINIVTSALVAYNMRKDKAKQKTEEFNDALILEKNTLEALNSIYKASNASLEDRAAIMGALAAADDRYAEALQDENLSEEERNALTEKYIELRSKLNNAEKARNDFAEENKEILAEEVLSVEERNRLEAEQVRLLDIVINGKEKEALIASKELNQINHKLKVDSERIEANKGLVSTINLVADAQKALNGLLGEGEEEEKDTQAAIAGTIKFFNDKISELQKLRDNTATTTEEVDDLNEQIRILNLQISKLTGGTPYKVDLEISTGKLVIPEDLPIETPENMDEQLAAIARGNAITWADEYFAAVNDGLALEKFAAQAEQVKEGLSIINNVLDSQFEKRLVQEKNKTTALNDELKRRLSTEQLSAEQRDKINQEIARNDAALIEEQNRIGKKQFQVEKAFKIVTALADIPSMMSKAYLSQLTIPTPEAPARAKLAAKIAAGFGLAQVAALTSLKYQDKQLPTPKLSAVGGGATVESATPDFNVVGGTQVDQLADAVRIGLSDTPIRSYVVSSDVTSAQEMDRKIVEGASI